MALRSFLMSFVVREYLVARADFGRKYPGAWLIWEPGDWKAPKTKAAPTEVVRTRAKHPKAGDALCFQLGSAGETPAVLTVGRDEQACELVVNDATVSRTHVKLEGSRERWNVATLAVDPDKQVLLDGRKLQIGAPTQLGSGAQLRLGGVSLTFLDSAAFERRLAALSG